MANPTVEKLKVFGLRHGEKVAMGVVAVIFATCAYFAWTYPSIAITPAEVKDTAQKANANINRQSTPDQIAQALEADGVVPQGFEKKVDALQAGVADATQYAIAKPFVIPEPGAGLIRETPTLLSPTQLYVHAGRGAIRVFDIDDEGEIKLKSTDEKKAAPRPKSSGRSGGMGLGMPGGKSKKNDRSGALEAAKKKRDDERAARQKQRGFAGAENVVDEPEKAAATGPERTVENSETTLQGLRYTTLIGKFDHKRQKELYARALKLDPASADPHYERLEIERQERNGDGTWGPWTKVNRDRYDEVDLLLTDVETEEVPKDARIDALVDRLPFLEVGYWVGAHHAALVPKSVLKPKAAEEADTTKGGGGTPPCKA